MKLQVPLFHFPWDKSPDDEPKIEMLMVHEICHAQKGCKSHGDQWKKKMQEVAYRCESAGNYRFTDQIRHEIENYSS